MSYPVGKMWLPNGAFLTTHLFVVIAECSQKLNFLLFLNYFFSQVHYRTHKCTQPVPILSQIDPFHTPTSYFLKIHLNIILLFRPGSPKRSISFRFLHQNPVCVSFLTHARYVPRSSYSRFYYPKSIG
jgi:hypothetical protein